MLKLQGHLGLAAAAIGALLLLGSSSSAPDRILEVLVVIAMFGAAAWSGWRIAAALLVEPEACGRTIAAFTVAVGILTCTATLLGHLGRLRAGPFFLLLAILFGASLCIPPRVRAKSTPPAKVCLRSRAGTARALLFAAAIALAFRCGGSALHVVRDAGAFLLYDDLSYHLPTAAVWRQAGDLRTLKFETGDPSPAFYPFVTELCSWTTLAALRDSDVLARRMQLPFALCSLIAVAALSRRLGLSRRSALLAALLYAAVDRAFPVLALGAGNDHATAFFSLAGLDGALMLAARPSRRLAAYTGVALGLLIGTKYIGLFYSGTILVALLVLVFTSRPGADEPPFPLAGELAVRHSASSRAAPIYQLLGVLSALMALCGGYAYARNAWTAGNPVFPAPVSAFGHRLLSGWSAASLAARRNLPEARIDTLPFLLCRADIFGPLFPFTLLPAALCAPVLAFSRRRASLVVVSALPIALFIEFRYLIHDHRDLRYLLPAIALSAVGAAWLSEAAGKRWRSVLHSATAGAILVASVVAAGSRLHAGMAGQTGLLALFLVLGGLVSRSIGGSSEGVPRAAGRWAASHAALTAFVSLVLVGATAWISSSWIDRFQAIKLADEQPALALEHAAGPTGAAVAYVGANEPYLFFGSRLQNVVQIVPTDADLGAQYYNWGGSTHFPFDAGSARQWRANLRARRIAFVVAARAANEGPERGWMAADPSGFSLIYRQSEVEIWRVDNALGRSAQARGVLGPFLTPR